MSEGNGLKPLLQVDHLRQHFPVREGIVFRREVASGNGSAWPAHLPSNRG